MKFNSIKFKISVLYTMILGVILVLYTGILFVEQRFALYHDMDRELVVKAQEVSNAINSYMDVLGYNQRAFDFASNRVIRLEGTYPNQEKIAEAERLWLKRRDELNLNRDFVTLVNLKGEAVIISANMDTVLLSYFLKDTSSSAEKAVFYKNVDFDTHKLRVVNIPFYYKNKRAYLIQVGVSRAPLYSVLYGRMFFASITIPFILIFASFVGGVMTERILKPVVEVTEIARNITHKDLSVRVKTEHVDEELKYLVSAFNEMISRLDKSFTYIAEFSSNVAHELKTPLTIIRGEGELTLLKDRKNDEYKQCIGVMLEETSRMFRITEDLLLLSKLDYQPGVFTFEQVDFVEFIREVVDQERKIAAAKNISVFLDVPAHAALLQANRLHLRRLFFNLFNNAVKFTPAGGSITIAVHSGDKELKVSVTDTGSGIEPEHLDKIFNRFFHVDRNMQEAEGGSGLGLSIAQSIAKIHHADITVVSQLGKGSTFTVTFAL